MPDLTKRFVKCRDRYHLIDLDDIEYFRKHNQWPDDYEEIEWERELAEGKFSTLTEFLNRQPTHEEASSIAKTSDLVGIPVKKIQRSKFLVNYYPKYWLREYFGKE